VTLWLFASDVKVRHVARGLCDLGEMLHYLRSLTGVALICNAISYSWWISLLPIVLVTLAMVEIVVSSAVYLPRCLTDATYQYV
jgi:hypothetical protein